jgi:carbon storage regulator
MLVLSRKSGEGIMIGSEIELTVLAVCGERVRLGFNAPKDVVIHRQEVRRRVENEIRRTAAGDQPMAMGCR